MIIKVMKGNIMEFAILVIRFNDFIQEKKKIQYLNKN